MFQRLRTVSSPTLTCRAEGGGVLAARGHGRRAGGEAAHDVGQLRVVLALTPEDVPVVTDDALRAVQQDARPYLLPAVALLVALLCVALLLRLLPVALLLKVAALLLVLHRRAAPCPCHRLDRRWHGCLRCHCRRDGEQGLREHGGLSRSHSSVGQRRGGEIRLAKEK